MDELERLKRKVARERAARKEAEHVLEEKALELFNANVELRAIKDRQEAELKRRIAEIQEKERRYRNLIENASDLIYTCDVNGCITYVNPMMINLLGFSEDQLVGADFKGFVSPGYRRRVQGFYAFQLKEEQQSTYTEFPVMDVNGNEIWLGQTVDILRKDEITFSALARDISDRKKVEKSLMLSEEKYKSIIENMELGLLEVDKYGRILKAYPKFLKLTGYTNEELVGKDPVEYFLPKIEAERMKRRNIDRLEGKSEVYEVKLRRKDGTQVWVLISGAPYYNERGGVEGSVGIHLDISQQKEMEGELRLAKQVAEDSLRAKDLFLANISHEIRTPLNAIIGISELMLDSLPSQLQKKYLETIMASGDNLLGLINEILDLSKIESGKLELREEVVNLAEVMEHIHRSFSVIAGKKNVSVHLLSQFDDSHYYLTDTLKLKEVLFNLVGNAVKFTESGSVTIDIQKVSSSHGQDKFLFKIIDTGVGIPENELKDVFKIFTQASNTYVTTENGTGLGLSISNGIIEKMGGNLTVSSKLGEGSCFQFSLEFKRSNFKRPEEKRSNGAGVERNLDGLSVLVVEDAAVNRFLVDTILKKWGCEVSEAVNGLEAVEAMQNGSFDLILMDVRMPEMDGIEATKVIRNELKNKKIPIIALTANVIEGEIEKCKSVGMNGYLSKPYSQEDLYAVISKNKLTKQKTKPTEVITEGSLVNLDGIKNITRGDEIFQKRMVSLFIDETKSNIQLMLSAIDEEEEEKIVRIAHSMKAAVAHICTNEILSRVRSIEIDDLSLEERKNKVEELIPLLNKLMTELDTIFPN